ncbi:acyl-CoA thioesterase [Rhizobium binxianense]|uniref:acyl-CoA thioesterase n=1 Tax=Rhizobium binxianense TaxID=3024242 RepID=UPI002361C62E|nr:thioesterase family protein [Rhizobium sp. MC62]MDC9813100.1 thioesterase family protein [Rhizobium sp. MC62]
MVERAAPANKSSYKVFRTIPTRWSDNDSYGHMNNVVHYSMFDTAVNNFLIENGALNLKDDAQVFLVVETGCRYHAEMTFPDMVTAGIRVSRLGSSSVRYEIGLFRNDEETASAEGFFVHVSVDRISRRPTPFDDVARRLLEPLVI